ncbi:glycine receptor subunit alpha-3-like [Mytilus trossulus]|uniref:glycine receptor subunit alpha-3-like n=1 Tax=Mytilus trossulus TaxID=6551 RepID=UPI0030049809
MRHFRSVNIIFVLWNCIQNVKPVANYDDHNATVLQNENGMLRQSILEEMLSTYDKRFPPHYNDVIPVKVKVQMYVLSVFEIDASEMTFSISMFLRQEWVDRRLQFETKDNLLNISLDNEITKEIWVPDLAFTSDTHTYFHELTRPNRLMIIYPNGKVVYSIRVTGKFTCFMDLTKFPFDEQRCPIELESYGFTNSIISFQWTEPAAAFRDDVKHSQFELGETQSYTRNLTYSTGTYSSIGVTLMFIRRYEFYLIQIYAPSVLVVMLSWLSFWLDVDAIPARISLGILTVLTISSNGNMSVSMAQRVSYIRAIDIWNSVCLILVFCAVMEYAYVCVSVRVHQRRKSETSSSDIEICNNNKQMKHGFQTEKQSERSYDQLERETARTVDKISRVAFPLVFFIFNCVYWLYYMT